MWTHIHAHTLCLYTRTCIYIFCLVCFYTSFLLLQRFSPQLHLDHVRTLLYVHRDHTSYYEIREPRMSTSCFMQLLSSGSKSTPDSLINIKHFVGQHLNTTWHTDEKCSLSILTTLVSFLNKWLLHNMASPHHKKMGTFRGHHFMQLLQVFLQ